MKFQMYVDVVVRDKNGKVIERIRKRKCSSYVRFMIDGINEAMMAAIAVSLVDTSGNTYGVGSRVFVANAPSANASYGVRVGTGTTAVAISNYNLATPIAHGIGSGQLEHGATSVGVPSTVGSTRQFTVARTFTNNSGASITVNEVGLIVLDSPDTYYFLVERSLLTFSIANGASATVTYTLSVSV